APAASDRIGGLIEVPALAECLTLNKADFIRVGSRGAMYLAYRKALQEAISRQLELWGDARDATEQARQRVARPVERDLERVVAELAEEFPLLATLVQHRRGAQRPLPQGSAPGGGAAYTLETAPVPQAREAQPSSPAAAPPATQSAPHAVPPLEPA